MTERSRFWGGLATGDASEAPYDADTEFAEVINSVSGAAAIANSGGVLDGELNELAVSGTASPVTIATGRAIVDGTWYENDVASTVVIATPAASTRIDRIVLRKSWAAQTVRITRIAGVEGGGTPTLIQSTGVTWDIPLATASITTGGVITVTDARDFINADAVIPTTTILLNSTQSADLAIVTPSANTWTDFLANQNFTVLDAASKIGLFLETLLLVVNNAVSASSNSVRFVIDSGGTPINIIVSGGYAPASDAVIIGSGNKFIVGLTVGVHTVKIQVRSTVATNDFKVRPTTNPESEMLRVQILEIP